MLKKVVKHLQTAKDWGIIHRWSQPDTSFLASNFLPSTMNTDLPAFPNVDPNEPVAFLDAAHANDLRNCQSTIGYAFLLCGGVLHPTIARLSPSLLLAQLKLSSLPLS